MKLLLICNPQFTLPFDAQYLIVINSKKAYEQFWKSEAKNDIQGIIIQAELKWSTLSYYSSFKGIVLINDIRIYQKCWLPILVTSYYFSEGANSFTIFFSKTPIRLDPAVKYIDLEILSQLKVRQLPFDEPINDTALINDLKIGAYNKENKIYEELHYLCFQVTELLSKDNIEVKNILNVIRQKFDTLVAAFPSNLFLFEKNYEKIEQVFKECKDGYSKIFKEIINKELLSIVEVTRNIEEPITRPNTISILHIDDEEHDNQLLKKQLTKFNINCLVVSDLKTAVQILQTQKNIYVVICDYRFYDNLNRLSRKQGYHYVTVLRRSIQRRLRYIALTAMHSSIQRKILNQYGIIVFDKRVIYNSNQSILQEFVNILLEAHYEAFKEDQRHAVPDFDKTYQKFYAAHKAIREEYVKEEEWISDYAINFIHAVKNQYQFEGISKLPNLTVNLKTKEKAIHENLHIFRNILAARRTILGLYQVDLAYLDNSKNRAEQSKAIYNLIRHHELNKYDVDDSYNGNWKYKFRLNRQGVDYKRNYQNLAITIEEREWLYTNQELFNH